MYFPRRSEPLDLAPERLRGLRLSLNSPVVQVEDLPAGPARAAIVVHEEQGGGPGVTVAVRSLRSGAVLLYGCDGDLLAESDLAVAVDAALSFGESMGFLFDDDMLPATSTPDRVGAYARFVSWVDAGGARGSAPPRPAPRAEDAREPEAPARGAAAQGAPDASDVSDGPDAAEEPVVLEDVLEAADAEDTPAAAACGADVAIEAEGEAACEGGDTAEPPPAPTPGRAAPAAPPLSKFRGREAARGADPAAHGQPGGRAGAPPRPRGAAGPRGAPGSAPLGRVRLVKRRADGAAPSEERPSFLFRLLALF